MFIIMITLMLNICFLIYQYITIDYIYFINIDKW